MVVDERASATFVETHVGTLMVHLILSTNVVRACAGAERAASSTVKMGNSRAGPPRMDLNRLEQSFILGCLDVRTSVYYETVKRICRRLPEHSLAQRVRRTDATLGVGLVESLRVGLGITAATEGCQRCTERRAINVPNQI